MFSALFVALTVATASPAVAPPTIPPVFDVDRSHSRVGFAVRFMGLSTVEGSFNDFNGTIVYDAANAANSSVTVAIRTTSVNTGHEGRDRHLRSPDFFEAEKYPVILFRSEKIEKTKQGFIARGKLDMHGVVRDVTIPFTRLHDKVSDAWGNQRIGFRGRTAVSRKDYDIKGTAFWNSEYDPGRFAISDSVEIILEISATQTNWERRKRRVADTLIAVAEREGAAAAVARFRTELAQRVDSNAVTMEDLSVAGNTLLQRGKAPLAVQLMSALAESMPNNANAVEALGRARLASGDTAGALAAFEQALAIDPYRAHSLEMVKRLKTQS